MRPLPGTGRGQLRLATAFRIEQSARNVLLVLAAESLATLVPISPGEIGTQQGFAAILLTLRTLRFRRASDPDAAARTS